MSVASRDIFELLRSIQKNAKEISLAVRGHGGLEESWYWFATQPSPTGTPRSSLS